MKQSLRNSIFFCNFTPRTTARVSAGASPVDRLKGYRYPAAITGFVISIYVNPLNGEIVRVPIGYGPLPKLDEIKPRFAHRYPPLPVMLVCRDIGVAAPIQHIRPNPVRASSKTAVGFGYAAAGRGQPSPQAG